MSSEDTAAADRDASRPEIIERKVKPGGSVREFRCILVHLAPALAVIRYVVATPGAFATPVPLTRDSVSDGWFWKRRPYSLYRFRDPAGKVLAHRFDAVAGVEIAPDAITYRDLVLDWWVLPGGRILEEDRDELEALTAAGALTPADRARALRAAQLVLGRYRHVIDEVARLERRLHIWPG